MRRHVILGVAWCVAVGSSGCAPPGQTIADAPHTATPSEQHASPAPTQAAEPSAEEIRARFEDPATPPEDLQALWRDHRPDLLAAYHELGADRAPERLKLLQAFGRIPDAASSPLFEALDPKTPPDELVVVLRGLSGLGPGADSKPLFAFYEQFDPEAAPKAVRSALIAAVKNGCRSSWQEQLIETIQKPLTRPTGIRPDPKVSAQYRRDLYFQKTALVALTALLQRGEVADTSSSIAPLLAALSDPAKLTLRPLALDALALTGKAGEGALVAALDEPSSRLTAATVTGALGLADAREDLIRALGQAGSASERTEFLLALLSLPPDGKTLDVLDREWPRIPLEAQLPDGRIALLALLEDADRLDDPKAVAWLLSRHTVTRGRGYRKNDLRRAALAAAILIMRPEDVGQVDKEAAKAATTHELAMFQGAKTVLRECREVVACYAKVVTTKADPEGAWRAAKAAYVLSRQDDAVARQAVLHALDIQNDSAVVKAAALAVDMQSSADGASSNKALETVRQLLSQTPENGPKHVLLSDLARRLSARTALAH